MKSTLKKVGIAVLTVGVALNCGCVFRMLRPSETSETMTIIDESQITDTSETSATSTSQELTITPTPTPAQTSTPTPTPTSTPTPTPEATVTIAPTKMPTQAPTKAPTSAPTPTPTTAPEAWMEQKDTSTTYQGAMDARNEGCTLNADTNVYSDKSQSSVLVVWPSGRQFVASTSPDNWIQVYITTTETGAPVYGFIAESSVTRHGPIPRNATLDTLAQARAEELALLGEINHNNMPSEANWEGLSGSSGGYTLYMHCGDNFEATSIGIGRATYHRADGSTYSVTCMLLKR